MPSFYTIKEAIRDGKRLRVRLADGERVVEPHVLGRNRRGRTLMRAYQLHGPDDGRSEPWKLFDVAELEGAVETGDRFSHPRPGYRANDPSMSGGIIERF
jgi:hypothetical protein